MQSPDVDVRVGVRGGVSVVWTEPGVDHPLLLLTSERDLAAAVTLLGEDCRDALWPSSSIEDAGLNLLLVPLGEVITTRETSAPRRATPIP